MSGIGKRKSYGGSGRGARFSGPPAPKVTGVSNKAKATVQDVMRKRVKALARKRELEAKSKAEVARVDALFGIGPKGKMR